MEITYKVISKNYFGNDYNKTSPINLSEVYFLS